MPTVIKMAKHSSIGGCQFRPSPDRHTMECDRSFSRQKGIVKNLFDLFETRPDPQNVFPTIQGVDVKASYETYLRLLYEMDAETKTKALVENAQFISELRTCDANRRNLGVFTSRDPHPSQYPENDAGNYLALFFAAVQAAFQLELATSMLTEYHK